MTKSLSSHLRNIAIVGAGGQVGTFITNELLRTGKHTVTAITRAESTNQLPAGCETTTVDYNDHDSLVDALKGQDCLVITLAVTAPPDTSQKLLRAAADAKVPWVLPNEWGDDTSNKEFPQLFAGRDELRDFINKLGMSWTGVACSFWYEYSLSASPNFYGFDMPNKSVVFYDQGEQKIHTSTFPQVGRAVATLLSLPRFSDSDSSYKGKALEDYRNTFIHVASFKVSQKDMFSSLLRVTGTTESEWTISYQPSKERFTQARKALSEGEGPTAFGRMLYASGFFPGKQCSRDFDQYGLDNDILGLPQENMDEFTKKSWEMGMSKSQRKT